MKVLAIDIGLKLGYAVLEDDKRIDSGRLLLGAGSMGQRFNEVDTHIKAIITSYKPNQIAYEAVKRWMSSQAALIYGGIHSVIQINSYLLNLPISGYAPTEIKKICTGKGNADKLAIIEWVKTYYSYQPIDDNEADALAIGHTFFNATQENNSTAKELQANSKPSKTKRHRKTT